ncbi:MAG: aminoacetone oxidase family FAD-binding enzyme [Prevotella sp.]|nr:aminoacetone oxidase family FAD-binding enzyme [Prevotella sp.]
MSRRKVAVVGGGAAGFFLAINLKEMCPQAEVTIVERAIRVLRKVEISGGGRCNVTNTFEDVGDLREVFPRGHRLLKRLFRQFGPQDAWRWFEQRGVSLVAQDDHCVFPRSQDSHSIINLFLAEAHRLGIIVKTGCAIASLDELSDYDFICVTTGGQPRSEGLQWLGQDIETPVPSLFTLSIADERLHALMGTVVPLADRQGQSEPTVMLPGTKLRAQGALLITHWGMSGPAILRLSSYAARYLAEHDYRAPLLVNWIGVTETAAAEAVATLVQSCRQKQLTSVAPMGLPLRLWAYLAEKALGQRASQAPWNSLNAKEQRRLATVLTSDAYQTAGRAPHRDEFVTCGGVSLTAVDPATLQSRTHPGLFFAGEVLDVDGVTGGFNFQAAWTTAYTVASSIASSIGKM